MLNVVIGRLIQTQREQIAALKAFGYSNARIALHYGQLVALIVMFGGVLGTATVGRFPASSKPAFNAISRRTML